jgi:hypothetical protein
VERIPAGMQIGGRWFEPDISCRAIQSTSLRDEWSAFVNWRRRRCLSGMFVGVGFDPTFYVGLPRAHRSAMGGWHAGRCGFCVARYEMPGWWGDGELVLKLWCLYIL